MVTVGNREGARRPRERVTGTGDDVRLNFSGELELAWLSELEGGLGAALERTSEGGRLTVDLSDVEFVDCAAVGALIGTAHQAVRRRVAIELTGDTGVVARVLHLADARGSLAAVAGPG